MNLAPLKGGDYDESAKNCSRWKERLENLSTPAELDTRSKTYQMAMLKQSVGDEGLRILKMLKLTHDEDVNGMQNDEQTKNLLWTGISR